MVNIKSLEKRVAKLEKELFALKSRHDDSEPHHTEKHNKTTKHRKGKHAKTTKKGKRPLNAYFKIMLAAKKAKKPSFVYNNTTYKGIKDKRFGMIYKKA
jgi:hypothetical protein|tara:strand:+ start:241 stop:537 length:297 start_codon:yes stop_codon:yes gene_type:complete